MTTLLDVARQLEHLSARLAAKVRPGHVEYISKQDAASALASIASALRPVLFSDPRLIAMQGLADALAVILEFHDKCGFKALDGLGQRSLDICITEARAALATAQRFTK